jgi:hypothetical protein
MSVVRQQVRNTVGWNKGIFLHDAIAAARRFGFGLARPAEKKNYL